MLLDMYMYNIHYNILMCLLNCSSVLVTENGLALMNANSFSCNCCTYIPAVYNIVSVENGGSSLYIIFDKIKTLSVDCTTTCSTSEQEPLT